jgi:glycosyltransferase involved in cell wall biosynthesis
VTVVSPPDGDGDIRIPFFGGRPFFRAARVGGRYDRIVVHFQPALYYPPRRALSKVVTSLGLLWLGLRRGRRVDIVVHEADEPSRWRPDYLLLSFAAKAAGRVWFHTEAERRAFERGYRVRVRGGLLAHRVGAVERTAKEEARRRLGLSGSSGPFFLCAGFLQPSKGFDRAVDALAAAETNGARLYIVGSVREPTPVTEAYLRDLRERCRAVPGVSLVERYVADEEFDLWLAAADWLVLPYRRSWSSGVLARAHAVGTPAIVSRVGGLPEQAGKDDVVFDDDEGLRRALRAAAAGSASGRASTAQPQPHGREPLTEWDPEFQPPLAKKGRAMLFGFILLSVATAATAQLLLKHGMTQVTHHGTLPLDLKQPSEAVRRIAVNASVWIGLSIFVLSAAIWLVVLSRVSLSFAYPFVSLTYVIILLFDGLVLHEPVSGVRWAGVALIVAGILLISRTHQTA